MDKCIIGVDIGGTTFSSVLFSSSLEPLKKSEREFVSNYSDTNGLLDALVNQIQSLLKNDGNIGVLGIGISCPGPLDSKSGIILKTPNVQILQNIPLKKEIQDRLSIDVQIENDANLFTLGEWFVNGKKTDQIFTGITLGTGLGFGVIINGKIYTGAHGLAAEYAISPIDNGNWESKVSIQAVKDISSKYFDGERISPKNLAEMARDGSPDAVKVWNDFGDNLGMALSHFINLIDPHKISVGGGISNAFDLFENRMQKKLYDHCPAYEEFSIDIFESRDKELSSQLGAALMVKGFH